MWVGREAFISVGDKAMPERLDGAGVTTRERGLALRILARLPRRNSPHCRCRAAPPLLELIDRNIHSAGTDSAWHETWDWQPAVGKIRDARSRNDKCSESR